MSRCECPATRGAADTVIFVGLFSLLVAGAAFTADGILEDGSGFQRLITEGRMLTPTVTAGCTATMIGSLLILSGLGGRAFARQ